MVRYNGNDNVNDDNDLNEEKGEYSYSYENYQKVVEGRFVPSRKKIVSIWKRFSGNSGGSTSTSTSTSASASASASVSVSTAVSENIRSSSSEDRGDIRSQVVLREVPRDFQKSNYGSAMNNTTSINRENESERESTTTTTTTTSIDKQLKKNGEGSKPSSSRGRFGNLFP